MNSQYDFLRSECVCTSVLFSFSADIVSKMKMTFESKIYPRDKLTSENCSCYLAIRVALIKLESIHFY